MSTKLYGATAVNGGGVGAMDSIKFATLSDGDICFVIDSGEDFHVFRWESSETTAESTPWTTDKVVEADDQGVNDGAWVLTDLSVDDLISYGNIVITNNIEFTTAPAADVSTSGYICSFTAGENLVFGNICRLNVAGKMVKADATDDTLMPAYAMAIATIANDDPGDFLLSGIARNDAWNWTVGGSIYASTTAGGMSQTPPAVAGEIVQIMGIATHADRMLFIPNSTYLELV